MAVIRSEPDLARRVAVRLAAGIVLMAACFFGSAGTFRWPEAWVYLVLQSSFSAALGSWLYRHNRALLEQRLQLAKPSALPADKRIMAIGLLLTPVYLVLPGIDAVRFGWAPAPAWLRAAAFCGIAAGLGVFGRVMVENAYLSRFVELQPGHRVVTTGPYRFVRHPMYAGLSVYFLAVPLALGSYWGLLPAAGLVALLIARTVLEDRMLRSDLPGYREYAERVRWRLVPGIW